LIAPTVGALHYIGITGRRNMPLSWRFFWGAKRAEDGMNFAYNPLHGIGGGTPIVDLRLTG